MKNTRQNTQSFFSKHAGLLIGLAAFSVAVLAMFFISGLSEDTGEPADTKATSEDHTAVSADDADAPNPTPDKADRQSQPRQQKPQTAPEDTEQEKTVEDTPAVAEDASSAPQPPEIRTDASEKVLTAAGRNPDVKSYMERSKALGGLGLSLSEADVETLRAFVREKPPENLSMRPIEYNALRNDALNLLVEQDNVPSAIVHDIAHVFNDAEQSRDWRSYAIQYFAPYWEAESSGVEGVRTDPDISTVDTPQEERALEITRRTLKQGLTERTGPVAGTALLSAAELAGENGMFSADEIDNAALDILNDRSSASASRMTAMRVAARRNLTEAVGIVRTTARNGASDMARMVAVKTLGEIGTTADRNLLADLTEDDNERISKTAQQALKDLNKK